MGKGKQKNKIYALLCKLDGLNQTGAPTKLKEGEIKKYECSLFKNIDDCMPQYLYRYRQFSDREYDNYLNDRVYLNSPEKFNDPTDSMAYVNFPGISEFFRLAMGKYTVEDMFKSEEELATLLNLDNEAYDAIFAIRKRIKTACFSEDNTESLMWSHYADYHKGFALRFDMEKMKIGECLKCEKGLFCHRREFPFFPVLYKEKRCDISVYAIARAQHKVVLGGSTDDIPIPLLPLLQKSEVWQYEKEWRLLCHNLDLEYINMKADAIFLGNKIEYEPALKLIRAAREKNQQIYKMYFDYNDQHFKLKYKDWTEWTDEDVEGWYYPNGKL